METARAAQPEPEGESGVEWLVWTATRFGKDRWSRWHMMARWKARRWAQMRPGAYVSFQAYPERHERGRARGMPHDALFWLEFDGPTLLDSCRGAWKAIQRCETTFPELMRIPDDSWLCLYYSGNRSIHMSLDLGLDPSPQLTSWFRRVARSWKENGDAPHADLGIYTEPRLLVAPGSLRWDNGRRVIRLDLDELNGGCDDPGEIVARSVEEGRCELDFLERLELMRSDAESQSCGGRSEVTNHGGTETPRSRR